MSIGNRYLNVRIYMLNDNKHKYEDTCFERFHDKVIFFCENNIKKVYT